jgi:hypothetical protein
MMENKVALVNKETKRVENIILVQSFDDAFNWNTDKVDAIPVQNNQVVYIYGLYDGENFEEPTNEHLISIGVLATDDIEILPNP